MTGDEAERVLRGYQRDRHDPLDVANYVLIAGRLRRACTIDVKPQARCRSPTSGATVAELAIGRPVAAARRGRR